MGNRFRPFVFERVVMPGLVPGIHVLAVKKVVDGRDIGERSDAVLRTAVPGHDGK